MKTILILSIALMSQVSFARSIELNYCGQLSKSSELCLGEESLAADSTVEAKRFFVFSSLKKVRGGLKMVPTKAIEATKMRASNRTGLGVAQYNYKAVDGNTTHTFRGTKVIYPKAPVNGTYTVQVNKGEKAEMEMTLEKVSKVVEL